jgi:hypothetical protein
MRHCPEEFFDSISPLLLPIGRYRWAALIVEGSGCETMALLKI